MNNENCLANILKVINILQNNVPELECDNTCTRPSLGEVNNGCYNTRLITLYRCDNSLVTLPYTQNNTECETTVFRVMNVTNNSVNVLLIQDNDDGTYTSTNTYATINLNCICAIRCIGDTTLTNI